MIPSQHFLSWIRPVGLLWLILHGHAHLSGQSCANYSPSRSTGITYNSIYSGSNPVTSWRRTTGTLQNQQDDNRSYPIPIGFDFWYLGIRYSTLSVSTNGFCDFSNSTADGNAGAGGCGATQYRENPASFTCNTNGTWLALAPFYDDIWVNNGGSDPLANSIRYVTTGTTPNRVFTLEWINMDGWCASCPGNIANASLNFQVKLYESTGVIEFVYGIMNPGINTWAYAAGINNSSISATPTAAQLLHQTVANSAIFSNLPETFNLATVPDTNTMISLTPVLPTNPGASTLTLSGITSVSMNLSWPDWATGELGYVIYNSTDGVNYTFVTQRPAGTTSYAATSLLPGTTYYWRVYAISEGALSTPVAANATTLPKPAVISATTGSWSVGATWVGGVVPVSTDDVIIADGHTVTVDTDAACDDIQIGQGTSGTLVIGNNGTSRTLIFNNINILTGGTFISNTVSASTHYMWVKGNITNNGTFNLNPGSGSICGAFFYRNGNQTISGNGATTNFYSMIVRMAADTTLPFSSWTSIPTTNTLEILSTNFSAADNFLIPQSGIFKYSNPGTTMLTLYGTGNSTIPAASGLTLNSTGATLNVPDNLLFLGPINIVSGNLNVGDALNEGLISGGAAFTMSGGNLTIAGAFYKNNLTSITYFTMSGGSMITQAIGLTTAGVAPFTMNVAGSTFTWTGGTIVVRNQGAGNLGYLNTCCSGSNNVTSGGTLQIGDVSTAAAQVINITSNIPVGNLVINATNAPTGRLFTNALTARGNINISGGTLNCNNLNLTTQGNFINDGTYTPGTNTSIFDGTTSITGSSTTSFYNFTINASKSVTGHPVNMTITNNWVNNGTFDPNNGTVTFSGGNNQSVSGTSATVDFFNVVINKTANTVTFGGGITTINVNGSYTQTAGNFTPPNGSIINIGGNWTHTAGTFTPNSGTVNFNGSGAQQINSTTLAAETFFRLSLNKTAGTLLNTGGTITTLTVTNNFNQTQGDFTPPATLNIGGNWTHDAGTFNPGTGTVVFNLGNAQQITSSILNTETFYNLIVNKTAATLLNSGGSISTIEVNNFTNTQGNFTSPQTLNINGNLTLTAGTFTAGTLINIKGNWAHNGGTIIPGTGTVQFSGTGAQQISGVATQTFNHFTINKTAATLLNTGANPTTITIQGNYLQTQGDFTPPATLNIGGNFTHETGTFTPGTRTVVFNGTGAQQINSSALVSETFFNFTVNKTAGTLLNTGGTINAITVQNYTNTLGDFTGPATFTINGNATLTAGTFTAGALIDSKGNWTNNGGTFIPGSGTVTFTGTGAQAINGTAAIQGFNNFTINKTAGQTLSTGGSTLTLNISDNYTQTQGNFSPIANGTTNVSGNWVHDAGTYTAGTNTTVFNGTAAQQITSTALPSETFYRLTIDKTSGTLLSTGGTITTITVSNNYLHNQGDFTAPTTLNIGGNWTHEAGTFNPGTGTVVINGGGAQAITSTLLAAESFFNLTVNKSANILTQGGSILTLNVGNILRIQNNTFTASGTINVTDSLWQSGGTMNYPSTVNISNLWYMNGGTANLSASSVNISGDWTRSGGTVNQGTSTVTFNGTGDQAINGSTNPQTFNNLIVNKTAGTNLGTGGSVNSLTLTGGFTETQGNFISPATFTVAGNFIHDAGTFTPGTTTTFNGAADQEISSSSLVLENFINFTVNKASGNLSCTGTITSLNIDGNVTLSTNGEFTSPGEIYVAGNWTKASAVTFTQGTGKVIFDGAANQQINGTSASQTFYDIDLNKPGNTLNFGGSTTTVNIRNIRMFGGNFTTPATGNISGNFYQLSGSLTSGANIFIAGNWHRDGGTFTPGAGRVTFNGTGQQSIRGNTKTTFGRVTINNSNSVSPQVVLDTLVDITTDLTLTDGIVSTSAENILVLTDETTTVNIGNTGSFIDGPLRYNMSLANTNRTLNFPIGKGVYGAVSLVQIRHTNGTNYAYTAEVIDGSAEDLGFTLPANITHVSKERYWEIKRGLAASPDISDSSNLQRTGVNAPRLAIYYENEDAVTDPSNLSILKNTAKQPTTWYDIGGTAAGSPSGNITMSVISPNFTSFSLFTLGNLTGGSNPLPVELISFQGEYLPEKSMVELTWLTASELNNDYFLVERSADAISFNPIASVAGAGTTLTETHYQAEDKNPGSGINYYRLIQTDFDGTTTPSKIIAVDAGPLPSALQLYPNPARSGEPVFMRLMEDTDLREFECHIYDLNGGWIRTSAITSDQLTGVHPVLQGNEMAPAIYMVLVKSESRKFISKLVIY